MVGSAEPTAVSQACEPLGGPYCWVKVVIRKSRLVMGFPVELVTLRFKTKVVGLVPLPAVTTRLGQLVAPAEGTTRVEGTRLSICWAEVADSGEGLPSTDCAEPPPTRGKLAVSVDTSWKSRELSPLLVGWVWDPIRMMAYWSLGVPER